MFKIPTDTLFLGKNLVVLDECPSTNTLAAEMVQKGEAPDGTIVITRHQTAGRGQRGNTWVTEPNMNLTMSLVVQPSFLRASEQFRLNMVVSLAVRDTVSQSVDHCKIKWPNDILIGHRKVCGILIENQLSGSSISRSVIGIGLNVNQLQFVNTAATSLRNETGTEQSLPDLFQRLASHLEKRYLTLKGRSRNDIKQEYESYLYGFGQMLNFVEGDITFSGVIKGVNDIGQLLIETSGQSRAFDLKQIKYLLPS